MRKSVQISFGPNFVVLGLNKEIYNSGKYGPTKTECSIEENKDKLLALLNYKPVVEIKYFYVKTVLVTLPIPMVESWS